MAEQVISKKETAKVIARTVGEILGLKLLKRESQAVNKQGRVDKVWFDATITKTCIKNNINEAHIRKIGGWVVGAEVQEVEADE
jgi:hypothetical protein